ncbi:MAG: YebC/PmpR family DNA-binding transcriptional regulator [Verrucomicrobiota bacterium JB022]|nr:YebC/PmpR family DNA-binding transcriptional regulator [Verrucomicrobiota bacterium JB022]
MAGHSKWANTKRHKAAVDAKRGKIFSAIAKEITMSARAGGGDINFNPRLRQVINKAKASNMPADNIDRAVKKGTGELPGVEYLEILYEGFGPGGIGIIVEATTDNKNRAASEVRATFTKHGGSLGGPGSTAAFFSRMGQFLISADKTSEEQLMEVALEAGAEDIIDNEDHFEVRCPVTEFMNVSGALEAAKIEAESAELVYIPLNLVPVTDKDTAAKVLRLIDALDMLDDVQNVYDNSEIAPELIEE